jgi:hypothetical protein
MNDHGMNGEMHMNDYSFMGMHQYYWISIVVIVIIVIVVMNQYRKRK